MEKYGVYIPIDRRYALARRETMPEQAWGTALFADISGFTPLTEALVRYFGPQRGAEELTRYINQVYDTLVVCLHNFGGTVISFAGDAVTCWFDQDAGVRAASCALRIQDEMRQFKSIRIAPPATSPLNAAPDSQFIVTLAVKIALATGHAKRLVVGDPNIQRMDVLAGTTLYRLAAAEHFAEKNEVILDQTTFESLGEGASYADWRTDIETGERFGILRQLDASPDVEPFKPLPEDALTETEYKSWLLPPVYNRLQQGQGEFLAELRPALVLFLNFGGINFDQDPEAGLKLDAYLRWAQNVLARYEAFFFQLIVGDKGNYLYGAFGAPIAHEDDAVRAISAALDLLSPPVELGYIGNIKIGISQGRLRVGAYGGSQRRTYGVLGDDVNLAARLMQAALPGQILVNQAVYNSAGNLFRWDSLPAIRVKGKSDPIAVYAALEKQPRQTLRLHALDYALPMVGRQDELNFCDGLLRQARQNQGQVLGITAEAGMGKSRLIYEIVLHAVMDHGFAYYGGECQSYTSDTSYWVWQPIWRELFKIDPGLSFSEQTQALEDRLASINPELLPRLPLLGTLLNLPIPDNDLTRSLDAKLRKTSLETLLVDVLKALAAAQPLLITLEDCHWMDALSHSLLEVLGRAIRDLPVIILAAYRPMELDRLREARVSRLPNFSEFQLKEFTPEQSRQLIRLKLEQFGIVHERIPQELIERIVTQSQGNPFYIEELLNYIQDQCIDPSDRQTLARLDMPNSLQSLILSRLDQLTEREQITIKVASVIGRLFQAALLWGMYPDLGMPDQIQANLESLSIQQLTAKDPVERELTYFFKQIVTQQVAYENLPFGTRAMLHAQLAQYIEEHLVESRVQYIDLLAFHYLRGENWSKALEYNLLAAQRDQQNFANEAAITACQHALTAAAQIGENVNPQRIQALEILAEVLTLVGRYDEALENFSTARALVELTPPSVTQKLHLAGLCRKTAEVYERRSDFDTAHQWLQTGLNFMQDQNDIEAARIYLLGAGVYHRQGHHHEAASWCQKSMTAAAQIPGEESQRTVAQANYLLGGIHNRLGNLTEAIEYCQRSIDIYHSIDDLVGVGRAYNNLAINYSDQGNWENSRQAFQASLSINQKIGNIQELGRVANNLGNVYLYQGDWQEAERLFMQSNAVWRQLGAALPEAVTLMNAGRIDILRKNWSAAQERLARSLELYEAVNSEDFLSELERYWSEFYLETGDLDQALSHAERAMQLAIMQDAKLEEGLSAQVLGMVYLAGQNYLKAEQVLQQSLDILNELNSEYEAARTRLQLSRMHLAAGQRSATLEQAEQARAVFERLGARADLAQTDALIAMT